jgi:hypothetical protein
LIPRFNDVDDLKAILERFVPAAQSIMQDHYLVCGSDKFSITALELYLWTGKSWNDPCTDKRPGQRAHSRWYVNRGRNPNFGRIDIAAGDDKGIYAGILIREIDRKDGSAIALQKIIRGHFRGRNNHDVWSADDLEKMDVIDGSDIHTGPLRLVRREGSGSEIWVGPRIFNTKDESKRAYLKHPLRVATWPTEKLKTKMKRWDGDTDKMLQSIASES